MELDAAAERVVDARSARRLVPLELADVAVPSPSGAGAPVLFFRVLGRPDGGLRVELWERGEYHGQRTLSGAGEQPQLVARRVALAAAELGRRLARKREAALARAERAQKSREARSRAERARTQEGPVALRSELVFAAMPEQWRLGGPRLTGELSLRQALRLDVAAELLGGRLKAERAPRLLTTSQAVGLGPAYRWVLTRALDLDVSSRAWAQLLQVPSARALDSIADQDSTWTARLDLSSRLELRLTRQVRGALGGEAGGLLRSVRYTAGDSEPRRLRGFWWGASLGVVVTPP